MDGNVGEGNDGLRVRLTQPLWSGGRLTAGKDLARDRREAAKRSVAAARLNISLNVVEAYGSLISDRMAVDVHRSGLKDLDDLRAMIKRRVDGRISARSDYTLADARYSAIKDGFFSARMRVRAAQAGLSQMVGRPVTAADVGDMFAPAAPAWLEEKTRAEMMERALSANPEINRLRAEVAAARDAVRLEKSAWFPNIFLRGEQNATFDGGDSEGRVYIGLETNIPAGLGAVSRVRAAAASRKAAAGQVLTAQRALRQTLSRLFADYRSLRESEVRLSGNVGRLDRILASYKRLFLLGRRSWIDVLNMLRENIQTREVLVRTRARLFTVTETLKRHERGGRGDA